MEFPYLFEKGNIGNIEVRNRIAMAPMGIGGLMGYNGTFSDRAIDYFERRVYAWSVQSLSHGKLTE